MEVYTTVAGITDISGPTGSRSVIDKTSLADTTRQKEVGIADLGQISCSLIFDNDQATNTTLRTLFDSGAANNFQIVLPDSPQDVLSFSAFVLSFTITANIDDVVRAQVSLEIDGAVTWS